MSVLLPELNLFSFTSVLLFLFGWFTANLLSFSITSSYLGDMGRSLCADCHPRWDTSFSFFWQRKCIFTYSLRWLCQDATNQAKIFIFPMCFCFYSSFWLFWLRWLPHLHTCLKLPVFPPSSPPSPLPPPVRWRGSSGLRLASLHLIHITCLACHATDLFVLSFCMVRCGLDGGGGFFCFVLF